MPDARLVLRFARIVAIFAGAVLVYVWRRLGAEELNRLDVSRLSGEIFTGALERLGASFVKVGQILGSRTDLLSPGWTAALARLHDRVPPAPFEDVERVLAEELDEAARARIVRIDRTPLAAASVAQVHAGVLDDGAEVAIKVQRLAARDQIERDLAIMRLGARLLDRIPTLRLLSLPGMVQHFGRALHDQLDFRLEAANNRRFAEIFEALPGARVPRLHPDLCTERVLTMERIRGVNAVEPALGLDRVTKKRLAERGGHAILTMVFDAGFVHADLHPGNILLADDGTMVFIDLGMVAEIPRDLLRVWCDTFTAIAHQDGETAARLFYGYAPTVATDDYEAFERDVVEFFRRFADVRLGEVEVSAVIGGMMAILRRHRVQVLPVFTVVHLGVLVAEGLGKQFDPEADLVRMAMPYLVRANLTAPEARPPDRLPPPRLGG